MPAARLRLFVALELPEAVRDHLAALQQNVPGINRRNWTPAANLHLTLKFLGDVDADRLPALQQALNAVRGAAPFEIRAAGFCCFPNPRHARVLAAELTDPLHQLARLQSQIEAACEPLGHPRERRGFRAHVTLARGRPTLPPDAVADLLRRTAGRFPGPAWTVDTFTLLRSTLGGPTPVYEPVARFGWVDSSGTTA